MPTRTYDSEDGEFIDFEMLADWQERDKMKSARIESQSAAIDAALAELDASPRGDAHICEAKRLLRGAREAMK